MGGQNNVLSLQNSKKIPLVNETPGVSQQIRFLRCVTSVTNNLIQICKEHGVYLRILNISTGAAQSPFAGWSLYCSTKAATRMFFDCLVLENRKISVKHIDPGVIDTEMQKAIRNAPKEHFPKKNQFIKLKCNNKLKPPQQVAWKILADEDCL